MEGRTNINTLTDKPDYLTDAVYGECQYDNIEEAMEDCDVAEVVAFDTIYKGPQVYGVIVGSNWNDDMEGWDDYETKHFLNKEDAKRCAEQNEAERKRNADRDERQVHLDWLNKHPAEPVNYGFGGGGSTLYFG
jgi:uncharacterized protein YpmB